MSRLVLYYTQQGKFISGCCSEHLNQKALVRPRTRGSEIEVYCPICQSTLMRVANEAALRRIWDRAKVVMSPPAKRRR